MQPDDVPVYAADSAERPALSVIVVTSKASATNHIARANSAEVADFCDKNSLQQTDLARFLIARTIPSERKAR